MNNTDKIDVLPKYSYILCLLVVLLHVSIPRYFDYSGNALNDACHYFLTVVMPQVTDIAVPSFFVLSAFLFYRNFDLSKTKKKWKSRVKTLVVPYLIWNSIAVATEMLMMSIPTVAKMAAYQSNPFTASNIVAGILFSKFSLLWFILALIIYSFLCPLIFMLVRNRTMGILTIIAAICLYCFGYLNYGMPFHSYFEPQSICYYLTGAYIGCHYKVFFNKKVGRLQALLALVLLTLIICMECTTYIFAGVDVVVLMVKSLLFWYVFAGVSDKVKYKSWFTLTFIIYATQLTVNRVATSFLRLVTVRFLPDFITMELWLYIIAFIIIMSVCIIIGTLLRDKAPMTYGLLTGNRK